MYPLICILFPMQLARPSPRDAFAYLRAVHVRPQPRPSPAPIMYAIRVRLRTQLEEKGDRMRLVVGLEHRLIIAEVVTCVRRAKTKSAKSLKSGGIELSPQVRAGWHTPGLRGRLRGDPSTFDTMEATMASTCEHAHGSSAPEPRRAAGRAGTHHAPASAAISASASPPRRRPRPR